MRTQCATGFAAGVGVAIMALAATVSNQDAASDTQDAAQLQDMQQMMQQLQESHANPTMPGPFHEALEDFIGQWDVTITVNMGPDMPASTSKGVATLQWTLGKRFVVEHLDATLNMGGMTMPLESVVYTGYDSYRNVYVGAMFSSMSTEMITLQGGQDPTVGTWNLYGTMHEPMLNVTGRMVRFTTTFIDDDHHITEVYDLHAGEDYKVLEFAYTRR